MKRFIARKKIKMPRYKVIGIKIFIILSILLGLNILVNMYIDLFLNKDTLNVLNLNAFGLDKYYINNNLLYKNSYGMNIYFDKVVSSNNNNLTEFIINTEPIIYIYNTFQTDKYLNKYYNSYNIEPVITQASLILQEYLKNAGINSIVEVSSVAKVLKDNNIDYTLSYRGSRILLNNAKNTNSSLKYFIDIQLSDKSYEDTTCFSNDISYAKISWIVGTDNNNYLKNKMVMEGIDEKIREINSCISNGIKEQGGAGYHGVYNQDFDPNVMLVVVGGKNNTIEEVNRTLKILAKALATYIGG